ncbi:muscular LMNA-interacting protein isoform X18 [Castor canadensis]|uniref:Muscular LMNA-interacting protein isoform X18 n=1 Tax=Castor canadensis TaxID=51338 RepID=A0AC58N8X0_CASCN
MIFLTSASQITRTTGLNYWHWAHWLFFKVSSGDSEAKPLIFTFVPTVRRLPTHIQLADTSKFLVKIPEEPSDKSPETVNRPSSNDNLTFSPGSQQDRDKGTLSCPSEASGQNSQGRGIKANDPLGMQQSDLFKAEYVFIVDSEGEDETTNRKGEQGPPGGTGNMAVRPKSLAISSSLVSDVVRPKVREADLKASSHPEILHGVAPQQKHGQQYKTKSSYKAFAAIPTNTLLLEQKPPTTLPRAAGRETKYANLSSPSSTVSESQLTKPGVIRPVPVKSKILLKKEEEVYEPNPFSKYLEDNSAFFPEQLSHPMVAIPEHETLDSKEQ